MSALIDCVSPESLGLSSSRLDRVADYLKEYVDSGKLPGYLAVVARHGQPVYLHRYGLRDVEAQTPVEEDTIFRIYSMTKPITSVALMSLYERGLFQLDTPVSAFIPAFKHLEVFQAGDRDPGSAHKCADAFARPRVRLRNPPQFDGCSRGDRLTFVRRQVTHTLCYIGCQRGFRRCRLVARRSP